MVKKLSNATGRELIIFFLPSILIIIIGFIAAYQFVEPSPPRSITIAAGEKGGAYYKYANTYKALLKEQGVELIVKETQGSAENLDLLEEKSSDVSIAFIQGGVGRTSNSKAILSIGSLYYEPLWIFLRPGLRLNKSGHIKGMTLAVGEENSGTRLLAMELLAENGITEKNTRFLFKNSREAADLLLQGKVDAAFFVSTHWSTQVSRLLENEALTLLSVDRAQAYTMIFKYLTAIKIPQGLTNLEKNIPDRDILLLSPTAQLAVRSDFHPALIDLILQTARKVHRAGGLLEKQDEFPSPKLLDFELSPEAQRFYKERTPFLQRYFPFWVATLLSRIKVMILPFIAIVFPLFKLMPFLYRWRMRSKVWRWYSDLGQVGEDLGKKEKEHSFETSMARLDEIERSVADIKVPEPFAEGLFQLRMHIDMFRKKLIRNQNRSDDL